MKVKALKFGGSSLADAGQIRKACAIIKAEPSRKYVVVSAPGKRFKQDIKVTDLLYAVYNSAAAGEDFYSPLNKVKERYEEIIKELNIDFDLNGEIETIAQHMAETPEKEYVASRGEYLNAKIISAYLEWPFADAEKFVFFDEEHRFMEKESYAAAADYLKKLDHCVIPGFYGIGTNGGICTFSRGGSDITGAIAARAVRAELYENWTDVSGMLTADPGIIEKPQVIDWISYRELRELSYMGASVLHEDAVFPVKGAGIPINIRNTNRPEDPGTMIVAGRPENIRRRVVTGIAGKKGLSNIQIEKSMMNASVGFGAAVLSAIAKYGVSYEHTPTSIDTMSVLVDTKDLDPVRPEVLKEVDKAVKPDRLFIEDGIAVVAVVGEGLYRNVGFAAKLFSIISEAKVNVRMIDVGFNELTIIIGIDEKDYEKAFRAIYKGLEGQF